MSQKVVELWNRLPHQNHPDWVAFASGLRSLWALEDMPITVIAESIYGFAEMGNHFTAEQLLDEIDSISANLRARLRDERARTSKL